MNVQRANQYAATCDLCGLEVAPNAGIASPTGPVNGTAWVKGRKVPRRAWVTRHRPQEWAGSPVSGRWIHGCPTLADEHADARQLVDDIYRDANPRRAR